MALPEYIPTAPHQNQPPANNSWYKPQWISTLTTAISFLRVHWSVWWRDFVWTFGLQPTKVGPHHPCSCWSSTGLQLPALFQFTYADLQSTSWSYSITWIMFLKSIWHLVHSIAHASIIWQSCLYSHSNLDYIHTFISISIKAEATPVL